jgi:hypothetical protein
VLKEAIEKIIALAAPARLDIDGVSYSNQPLKRIDVPWAAGLEFSALKGFVDYIDEAPGEELVDGVRVHVVSPHLVRLIGPLHRKYRARECFARAAMSENCGFRFGEKYDAETFTIALMTLFGETPRRENIIKLVGNMTAEVATTSTDDGMSQTVGQRAGVSMQAKTKIENPFDLSPHRTFPEVAQPLSPFIFRVHQNGASIPQPALYECDNGAWKLEAIKSIAEWIRKEFKARKIEIPVLA